MAKLCTPKNLAAWCLAIKHGHGAGIALPRVFDNLAKSGPAALRPAAKAISAAIKRGDALDHAFRKHLTDAPQVLHAMATVADHTGHIPEIFGHLEQYFHQQETLEREFRAKATWPMIQLVLAIMIIVGLFVVLGLLGTAASTGIGQGVGSLACGLFVVLALVIAGFYAVRLLRQRVSTSAGIAQTLNQIPSVSGCLQAMAMSRFCLALQLTTDSSMPIDRAVQLSLESTGLATFTAQSAVIITQLKKGADLSTALGKNPLFPNQFLGALSVGELSGQIPEVMARQAIHYREETSRKFARLTMQLNVLLGLIVAGCLIAGIFILANNYINTLNHALTAE